MEVFNRNNSRSTGALPVLTSWMLVGSRNSSARDISIQVSEIPVGSQQPLHAHAPEQCYYIVRGRGLMTIDEETREVFAGDAVFIPSNASHGIRNTGGEVLEYLTANSPPFTQEYENKLWPEAPAGEPEASV